MSNCCDRDCAAAAAAMDTPFRKALWIALAVNAAMFGVEIAAGLRADSVSLLADAVDFFGDAANYGVSLFVLALAPAWRSRAALAKGLSMGAFGLAVLALSAHNALGSSHPDASTMGGIGLLALLLFATFNNFLGGAFMALLDPYGLSLVAVEEWGVILALTSLGFVFGGFTVARRGLGRNPVRTLLVVNLVMWTVTIVFPIRSEVLPLMVGFLFYMTLIPFAEASEQTIIQKVVPFTEQGRVFGLSQALESAASPITAFLIGPIAQFWIIPSMTDGALAATIGPWFGTGPARAMALIFIVFGVIGLVVTLLALRSRYYRDLSGRYLGAPPDDDAGAQQPEAAAAA